MRCLVFHLYGPMSAWGNAFIGSKRTSDTCPSKSAIVGIIAGSLGMDRGDIEGQKALFENYDYAVYSAGLETKIRDYHTVETSRIPSKPEVISGGYRRHELSRESRNIILSERVYICDGYYSAYVFPKDGDGSLEKIRNALESPVYTPYLGRKSCPAAFPMCPEICDGAPYDTIVCTALKPFLREGFQTSWALSAPRSPRIYSTFEFEDYPGEPHSVAGRRDDNADRCRWSFSERREYCYEVE